MKKMITIRKERFYASAPEDVWEAITDARALAEWLEPNNHQPVVGHKFEFMCDSNSCGGYTEGEVMEVEKPRRLVWKWVHVYDNAKKGKAEAMTVSWTLEPKDGGTLLILEQKGAENIGWIRRNMMRLGWTFMMKKLIPKVIGRVRMGRFTPGAIPLEQRYYKCKTIPAKYVR
jgi:uncharacterized protein YndB with AHSA1/START domain